ncbi:unnamed protein product [Cladocopium goreaui]|uniref:MYND-type domain-containing protein n=1 Tax=Cladocopium goreaui TaxID=2562237 RepID=A0A9P1BLF4_9DINO|nr:unnamed protein product [Cladocopium goreaui]
MTGCCNVFKVELRWPEQIATSNWFPPLVYTIFNGLLAIVFVAFLIMILSDSIPDIGAFWLIYLTNWALIVETIAMVMLCISTVWAYAKLPDGPSQGKAPLFVRYTVALWYLIQPLSLIVVILLLGVNEAQPLNALEFSFFAARIPWSFKNFIWGLVFLLTYLGWTLIHFFAQIGTPRGCELYIDPECPIYDAFDWNMPMMTTIITIFALVGYAVLAGLYTAFVRCRQCCFPTPVGEVETKDGPQNIETIENAA